MSPVEGNKLAEDRPWSQDSGTVSWRLDSASDIDPANDPKIRSHVQRLMTPTDLATLKKEHTVKSTDWPWANSLGAEVGVGETKNTRAAVNYA
eukprot:1051080-Pyramimonas_sp.AAC.1